MAQPRTLPAPALKTLVESTEQAKETAREEIAALRKDLAALERLLSGKRKSQPEDVSLHDIVHGALEIFRCAALALENERLLDDMHDAVERALAEDFLHANGATLLREPEGWHWISPKGVMHHLATGDAPAEAAKKLRRHLPRVPAPQRGAQADTDDAPESDA
ncbi:signal transduction histidine kinase [Desulfobaculum xiamenense]|uniref:Signal transduction histidine kinase n=1 Tax=Desulfobaculum xiamenense TaxID=995050 RepID=A0A846QH20_9BACT|nr:hypothetical protein [Desulfobaculum xiamenense]NJB67578.1 signal transduction histidine kinase [Desulfobaculum xiamenense]